MYKFTSCTAHSLFITPSLHQKSSHKQLDVLSLPLSFSSSRHRQSIGLKKIPRSVVWHCVILWDHYKSHYCKQALSVGTFPLVRDQPMLEILVPDWLVTYIMSSDCLFTCITWNIPPSSLPHRYERLPEQPNEQGSGIWDPGNKTLLISRDLCDRDLRGRQFACRTSENGYEQYSTAKTLKLSRKLSLYDIS